MSSEKPNNLPDSLKVNSDVGEERLHHGHPILSVEPSRQGSVPSPS